MGSTSRKKQNRGNRKSRSAATPKPETNSKGKTVGEPGQLGPNPNCGSCSEEQLEEVLLKKLHCFYSEVLSKLVALGYDEDSALTAVLRNGHCYGALDVVSNILNNAIGYLNAGSCGGEGCECESEGEDEDEEGEDYEGVEDGGSAFAGFTDLKQLEEYSLAGMVCLLQKFKPKLTKVDAMWCLLMCDLHVGRASSLEITAYGSSRSSGKGGNIGGVKCCGCGDPACNEASLGDAEVTLEGLKRSSLPPSINYMLRSNGTGFAAGFQANPKCSQTSSHFCQCASIGEGTQHVALSEVSGDEQCVESQSRKRTDDVNAMLCKFRDMLIEDKMESVTDEQKEEMIKVILKRIGKVEQQVRERKEWAQQKALQAARKLSGDLKELMILRTEREDTQRLMNGKQTLDESTMKRLAEMENALRKASGQVDRANAFVKRLETENAETRAELEAAKLSASESVKTSLEIVKREKKIRKRLLTWEKQKTKLQEEIANEKQNILELQSHVAQIKDTQKDAQVKIRQELTAKELALARVEEERRLKEAAEANSKRKLEALRLKIEIDFQRQKDDLQRLEQEHSRLKASVEAAELQSNASPWGKSQEPPSQKKALERLLDSDDKENSLDRDGLSDRECMICMEDEASVVFLPCAHQVLCSICNDKYGKKGRALCPCCGVPIEQRIRVYGASS